jgi:predicted protein tyrosine phosphatase
MKFVVLNRDYAERFTCEEPYIHICITDPKDTEPKLPDCDKRIGLLHLRFHDWDIRAKELITVKYRKSPTAQDQVFFTEDQAREIIKFVHGFIGRVNVVVVNCAAGISRSPAVAAALSKCLCDKDGDFFKRYIPNSLVYSTILRVWYDEWGEF